MRLFRVKTLVVVAAVMACAVSAQAVATGYYSLMPGWWGEIMTGGHRGAQGNILSGFANTPGTVIDPTVPDPFGGLPVNIFDKAAIAAFPGTPTWMPQWIGGVLTLDTVSLVADNVDPNGDGTRVYQTTYKDGLIKLHQSIFAVPAGPAANGPPPPPYLGAAVMGTVLSTHFYSGGQLTGFQSGLTLDGKFLDGSGMLNITGVGRYADTSETKIPYDLGPLGGLRLAVRPTGVPDGGATIALLGAAFCGLVALRRKS
jgi:hypothetical protein